jgi:hypothetical protein
MDFAISTQASYLLCFAVLPIYIAISYWKKKPAQLPDAILLLLAVTSIPPCIRVIFIIYQYNGKPINQLESSDQFYIMIGALAVIWLSCNEIIKKFNDKFL